MKAMTMNYNITPKMIELFEIIIGWQKRKLYDRAEVNAVQKQYIEENCDWSIFCHYWSNFAKFQIPTDPNERSKETKILNHFK